LDGQIATCSQLVSVSRFEKSVGLQPKAAVSRRHNVYKDLGMVTSKCDFDAELTHCFRRFHRRR